MNYREQISELPDYLLVRCHGKWDPEVSCASWQRVAERLRDLEHGRVLVDDLDIDLETTVSIDYEHASFVAEQLAVCCRRLAIVDMPQNDRVNRFFETVCNNRGLRVRFFNDMQSAIDWLLA